MSPNTLPLAKEAVAVAMNAATIAKRVKPVAAAPTPREVPEADASATSSLSTPKPRVQDPLFPPAQTPAQMGLSGADPQSPYYRQPYSAETLELEIPYFIKRCRWAIREIAEAWQALVELGAEVPSREGRMYQRITERYAEFSGNDASAGALIPPARLSEVPNERG